MILKIQNSSIPSGLIYTVNQNVGQMECFSILSVLLNKKEMKTSLLLTIFTFIIIGYAQSQEKQGKAYAPLPEFQESRAVDTAFVRIAFAFNPLDINKPDTYIDLQYLDIGTNLSRHYSYWVSNNNLLVHEWNKKYPNAQSSPIRLGPLGRIPDYSSEYQYSEYFKDYKENLLTEYARMPHGVPSYQSSEKIPVQDWNIGSDTLSVIGYLCQQATCFFRGRYYTAWFAKDIPISNGPWKFGGLPGLILKIYDNNQFYTWECIKIEPFKFPLKRYDFSHYKPVERLKLLKLQRMLNEDFYKVMGVRRLNGGKLPGPVSYEPLELE